jgi:hypothetical protein
LRVEDAVWSFVKRLYQSWVSDGDRIHPSWTLAQMYRLYLRYLNALMKARYPDPYGTVESLFEMADPSEDIHSFDEWARGVLASEYGVTPPRI